MTTLPDSDLGYQTLPLVKNLLTIYPHLVVRVRGLSCNTRCGLGGYCIRRFSGANMVSEDGETMVVDQMTGIDANTGCETCRRASNLQ